MRYAKMKNVTTDRMVEDGWVKGDNMLLVVGVRGFTAKGLCERENKWT